MKMLAIDPGLRGCGVSFWTDGVLMYAEYLRNPAISGQGVSAWYQMARIVRHRTGGQENLCFVAEVPQVYQGSNQKGDPNDLIELAGVVGAVAWAVEADECVTYRPREWKGQTPKEIMLPRIRAKLSQEELDRVNLPSAASLQHNVWDAVGIGLKAAGRLNPMKAVG